MNHIKRLMVERESQEIFSAALVGGINGLRNYLTSDKFHVDTTVQVADVLRRLEEILSFAGSEQLDFENSAYRKE